MPPPEPVDEDGLTERDRQAVARGLAALNMDEWPPLNAHQVAIIKRVLPLVRSADVPNTAA